MTTILGPWSTLDEVEREGGGKAANLARVGALGVNVPVWCCVPASAFDEYRVGLKLGEIVGTGEPPDTIAENIERRLIRTPIPDPLRKDIRAALAKLSLSDTFVAVRSSGIGEDSAEHSFAGQYSSFLFQREEPQIIESLRRCWASAWSARNVAYRKATGLDGGEIRMGVVIQKMINAESSGVAFSRNPLRASDRSTLTVESVFGLGEGLVSGLLDADHFDVNRETLEIHSVIADKKDVVLRDPIGGVRTVALGEKDRLRPSLTDDQVREVARLTLQLETALGAPQDIEFAVDRGQLHCLQTRPITTLPPESLFEPAAQANVVIWGSILNIIESFAGVTTPLTFTHVNRCYYEVYLQFCRVMGVDESTIAEHDAMFRNMLGMVRGRIYYNLVNWYRLLGLFPGVSATRGFMETMMGVQQSLTPELAALFDGLRDAPRPSTTRRATIALRTLYRLTQTQGYIDDFMQRIERVYVPLEKADLRALPIAEQQALYHRLEKEVLMHWTAPIVNDTRCMVTFGLLGALTMRLPDRPGEPGFETQRNDLLCGEGDLKSTEPTKLLMRIASKVDADPAIRARFLSDGPVELWAALQSGWAPDVLAMFGDFLQRYGFRCVNELKLEEPDLHDDPRFVVSSVQSYVRMGNYSIEAMESREAEIRGAAEKRVAARLSAFQRAVYFKSVRWARRAVSDRELLRFERTRTFGVTRRLFRAMGANLVKLGVIDGERDVFYLTLQELMAFREGIDAGDLRAMIASRRRQFDAFRSTAAPPDRFVTRGPIDVVEKYPALLAEGDLLVADTADDDPSMLRGTACSPGVVEAEVRVCERLEDAEGMNGQILVTERTDPGWVPLFPACGGLIIERGSLLSHSAVVARELGIPTIVGVRGKPMQRLKTGQRVRMDGGKGEVKIL